MKTGKRSLGDLTWKKKGLSVLGFEQERFELERFEQERLSQGEK